MMRRLACAAILAGLAAAGWAADDFDQPPISYRTATPANAVSRLQARIDAGMVRLPHEKGFGHLRAVLAELAVPVASQTLVFSKTSLQYSRISSRSPRAVYFNDDVYVGFVRGRGNSRRGWPRPRRARFPCSASAGRRPRRAHG